ncbi:MAG: hypothetical protein QOK44_4310 [Betaproteobacteria bacterium]|nr:hypothetical protein [Betaproteobacteria bacterium]
MFYSFVRFFLAALTAALWAIAASWAQDTSLDPQVIESITGLKVVHAEKDNVFKICKPRDDVKFIVDGVSMPPFMGLTSTAMFIKGHGSNAMVMGDTVLLQDEVNPVMSIALESGLEVTALHNHFFFDEPKVYFMHVGGEGEASKLAEGIKRMYDKVSEIRAANPRPAAQFGGNPAQQPSSITAKPVEAVFGTQGESNNGMFKVVIGRTGKMHGLDFGKDMGLNTWAAFAGSDQNAIVDGDFAMLETELQPVVKSLRKDGINIVAIHQHMSGEQPRYLFLHYWGKGPAADLARAVKRAVDLTK